MVLSLLLLLLLCNKQYFDTIKSGTTVPFTGVQDKIIASHVLVDTWMLTVKLVYKLSYVLMT